MFSLTIILIALAIDHLFGEPSRAHPTVLFGKYANAIERRLNNNSRLAGLGAWALAVLPFFVLSIYLEVWLTSSNSLAVIHVLVVYWAIAHKSLREHADAVRIPLQQQDLDAARHHVSMIVSRDTSTLNETDIARATSESVLENGADAVLNALFCYLVAGLPGIILYRLSNTLDAMWGYRNKRFHQFGLTAARVDDVLNYLPARLTALSYALAGDRQQAFTCWRQQAHTWKSPNAGPVMASGAGAINVSLGGAAYYHGELHQQPHLGPPLNEATRATASSITAACNLLNKALGIWLLCIAAVAISISALS